MGLVVNPNGKLEVVSHGNIDAPPPTYKVRTAWKPVTVISNGTFKTIWLRKYKSIYFRGNNIMNVEL